MTPIKFARESVCDPIGRVFFYEGNVYRAISEDHRQQCLDFLGSELFKQLTQKNYIPETEIASDIQLDGFSLILHHEKCTISKPYEWTFEMFKDASLFILELRSLCNKCGYELKDSHPFNVSFHKGKPIWIDIGSIIPSGDNDEWIAKNEFIKTCIIPLLLWKDNDYFVLRSYLESDDLYYQRNSPYQDPLENELITKKIAFLRQYHFQRGSRRFTRNRDIFTALLRPLDLYGRILKGRRNYKFIRSQLDYRLPSIEEIKHIQHDIPSTIWGDYCPTLNPKEIEESFPRFNRIYELFMRLCCDCHSMLDLAGNSGQFSLYMSDKNFFNDITFIDNDENALQKGYVYIREHGLEINALWSNLIFPPDYSSISNRLQSDVVFALAITHHLILTRQLPLQVVLERIGGYASKYVFVEFMPKGLWVKHNKAPEIPEWYTEDWFKNGFEKNFKLLHIEHLEENRTLFIGEKHTAL